MSKSNNTIGVGVRSKRTFAYTGGGDQIFAILVLHAK